MIETGGYRPSEEIAAALKAPELADLATVREEIAALREEARGIRSELAALHTIATTIAQALPPAGPLRAAVCGQCGGAYAVAAP
jgi:hypothetical protein